jgi:hypothetical protein
VRPAHANEPGQRRSVGVVEQTPRPLPGRVEHGPGKPGLAHQRQKIEIGLAIGEQHANHRGAARDGRQRADTVGAAGAREQPNLDVIDA